MVYTVHQLLPVIPMRSKADSADHMWNAFADWSVPLKRSWQDRCSESAEDFEESFTKLCKRYDSPDWDTDVLRSALEL
ncbi:MAG: hypothetical protein AAES65_02315 [Candidatus Thiodiazotropha sp. (ex. Lucinoma kazani)]